MLVFINYIQCCKSVLMFYNVCINTPSSKTRASEIKTARFNITSQQNDNNPQINGSQAQTNVILQIAPRRKMCKKTIRCVLGRDILPLRQILHLLGRKANAQSAGEVQGIFN